MTASCSVRHIFLPFWVLTGLCLSSHALAYVVYSTSDVIPPETCILPQPQKLIWSENSIEFWIQPPSIEGADSEAAIEVIRGAYENWNEGPDCGHPELVFGGSVEDPGQNGTMPVVGFDPAQRERNQNVLVWVTNSAQWIHGPGVLGLTTLTYNTCDGEVVDGDIEINAAEFQFALGNPSPEEMDLENTVTHEVGHLLGLDHSNEADATMFFNSPEAETKKSTPEMDDYLGLCCLYCVAETHIPGNVCQGEEIQCLDATWSPGDDGEEELTDGRGCGVLASTDSGRGQGIIMLFVCFLAMRKFRRRLHAAQVR